MTRVIVYAASPVVRAGLESIVCIEPVLELVGSASEFAAVERLLEERQPDVLLMEQELSGEPFPLDGASNPAVVVLVDEGQSEKVTEALLAGVQAVLPSSATAAEILAAVKAAAAGLVVLHPDVAELILKLNSFSPPLLSEEPIEPLTSRELEVLQMLALGLGNKVIASRLHISEHTVKFHLGSIFSKLNASSRTEAVTLGLRQGLILL